MVSKVPVSVLDVVMSSYESSGELQCVQGLVRGPIEFCDGRSCAVRSCAGWSRVDGLVRSGRVLAGHMMAGFALAGLVLEIE